MTKALKNLLLVLLALCMSVCIGLFAVACNSGDDKEPNHKTDQDGEDEGEEEEEEGEAYTVTLDAGDGSLEDGVASSYTTKKNGKLSGYLPVPTISTKDWGFFGWYTAAEGGTAIDETTHVFTEDVTLYAHYGRLNGVWNEDGTELIAKLSRNTGETTGVQYWLGNGVKIALEEGEKISLYLNAELVTFNVHADFASSCIKEATDTYTKVTSVTVSEDASFKIYLWDYSNGGGANWSCQFLGQAATIPQTGVIPEGCDPIKVTGADGTAIIYLVVNGVAVNSSNGANYQIHGWQDSVNNIFGEWDDNPTLDTTNDDGEIEIVVESSFDDDFTLMFHWNGGQSGNVSNVAVDGSYVIKVNTLGGTPVTVKEYVLGGPEDEEEEDIPQLVLGGYYLVGQGFTVDGVNAKFGIQAGFEIGDGITVDLPKNAMFKAVICTDAITGGPDSGDDTIWKYNEESYYKMAEGKENGYVSFTGGNNVVKTAGSYTITVDTTGDEPLFIITPAAGLEAAPEEKPVFYIIGIGECADLVGSGALGTVLATEEGSNEYTITVTLAVGDWFQFVTSTAWTDQHGAGYLTANSLEDDTLCFTVNSNLKGNIECQNAGTYKFTLTYVDGTNDSISWEYLGAGA